MATPDDTGRDALAAYLPEVGPTGKRWLRFAAVAAILAAVCWTTYQLRGVFTPILAALALAYILQPVIRWLQRCGIARLAAVIIIFIFTFAVLLACGLFLAVHALEQMIDLRDQLPLYAHNIQQWLSQWQPGLIEEPGRVMGQNGLWAEVGPLVSEHGAEVTNSVVRVVANIVSNTFAWLSVFVLIPMYTLFFGWRFDVIVTSIRDHLPARIRGTVEHVVGTVDSALANFFRGRLLVCLLVGASLGGGWMIVGVKFGLLLGLLGGLLNLVPFMSLLALPPALLVTYFEAAEAGTSWALPVCQTMGVFVAVQTLESFLFSPMIESRSSGLHPITTVIALLIGAELGGLLGMLLAIPITSTLKTLGAQWLLPEIRRLAAQAPRPDETEEPDRKPTP